MSHQELIDETDWAKTPLGPRESWPASLRLAVKLCMASRFPMLAFGGPDLVMIYNEGYAPMLGAKHPRAFGTPVREVWPEIWDVIGPMYEQVMTQRVATWQEDQLLVLDRYGYDEARYFTYSFSPIEEDDGQVIGVFTAVTETTGRVVGERNLATLRALAATTGQAQAEAEAWRSAAEVLVASNEDIEFACLDRFDDGKARRVAAAGGSEQPELTDEAVAAALRREVTREGTTVRLPLSIGDTIAGVLSVGLSPLRPVDDEYASFLEMAAGHIAAGVANARSHEQERRRVEELATLDRKARDAEERYRAFVATSSEAIWRFELEQPLPIHTLTPEQQIAWMFEHARLAECNDALAKQYGYDSAEELVGIRLDQMLLPDNPDNIAYLREFIAAGYRITDAESIESDRHGERRHFLNNFTAIIEDGRITRAWGTQRDITPVKRAEERLNFIARASEQLNATLDYDETLAALGRLAIENLADCCVTFTTDGVTIRVAAVDCRSDDCDVVREIAARGLPEHGIALASLAEGRTLVRGRAADDAWLRENVAINAVADAVKASAVVLAPLRTHGRSLGVIALFSATPLVAEDLQLAEELARRGAAALDNAALFASAQAANVAKDEFLATLSHELRTPMTATLGWAAMLRMGAVSEETFKVAIDALEQSTKSQAKLIDDILDVSRISTGKLRANLGPTHLRSVIAHAVDTIWAPAEAKQIAIEIDVIGFSEPFMADADRLQQVIWNLLSNAVKFTPRGGTVVLKAREEGEMAVVSVTDDGEGIAPEFLPSVFERFRQADSSASRRHGGLGLGLAIVKSLVEMHGGTVQAESRGPGFGATFTLMLPMNPPEVQASVARTTPRNVTLADVSVLIIDDEPATRLMLQTALAHFSAHVSVAGGVDEALHALGGTDQPHVVISDIAMPGQDGYMLLRSMRDSGVTVPVIALTAQSSQADRQRALEAGFDAWLSKPIDPTVLAREILRLARR